MTGKSDALAAEIGRVVSAALDEDLAFGPDVTTEATISSEAMGSAAVIARATGTIAGTEAAIAVLQELARRRGDQVEVILHREDGARVVPGDTVLTARGSLRLLLTAERTMLNLLCQLSGVATLTAAWVHAISGTGAQVRDTRKTVPGMRLLQKAAVAAGGGSNHRLGLGDAVLIKDNHVAAAGSITAALAAVRRDAPGLPVEVECDTLEQVREALDLDAGLILLDNMDEIGLRAAVDLADARRRHGTRVLLEASGGITLDNALAVAATGVDLIAVGELTHSAPVLDLGFDT